MRILRPFFSVVAVVLCASASADRNGLSARDISSIESICKALIGSKATSVQSDAILHRLEPYARSDRTVLDFHVVCDTRCAGRLALRGDAEIYISYPNSGSTGGPGDRIDTVVFSKNGKVLLSIGPDAH
jgi:hypothetical protein